jgi:N-acetylmuramic acid 6-phosphate (MurNAc-6-P) etherase
MTSRTPVTELPNELTANLDVAGPLGIVRLLRGTDAQIFAGYGGHDSLYDKVPAIDKTAAIVADLIRSADTSAVVLCGSGTSGRVAFMVAVHMNRVLEAAGVAPCFRYLISGGDPAILLSDELPEDDPDLAVRELKAVTAGKTKALVVGITCGLSAPYTAGLMDFAMDCCESPASNQTGCAYSACVMGFNPVELSRPAPIEAWSGRADNLSKTFLDVTRRMHRLETHADSAVAGKFVVLNPVVGPEAVAASSRMKGGSVTTILCHAFCTRALAAALPDAGASAASTPAVLQAFEATYRETYWSAPRLAAVVQAAGECLRAGGHVYYVGAGNVGGLGCMDASEMPDT